MQTLNSVTFIFYFLFWWRMGFLKKKCCLSNWLELFPFSSAKGEEKKRKILYHLCFYPTQQHFDLPHWTERIFLCSFQCSHILPSCPGTLEESYTSSAMPPFSSEAGHIASSLTHHSIPSPWTDITSQLILEESLVYQKELKQKAIELQFIRRITAMQCGSWTSVK